MKVWIQGKNCRKETRVCKKVQKKKEESLIAPSHRGWGGERGRARVKNT